MNVARLFDLMSAPDTIYTYKFIDDSMQRSDIHAILKDVYSDCDYCLLSARSVRELHIRTPTTVDIDELTVYMKLVFNAEYYNYD